MRNPLLGMATLPATTILFTSVCPAAEPSRPAAEPETLNVLFIGNSFTASHNLAQVVKAMAEAGDPALRFDATTVLSGGRRLVDHWRLGTQTIGTRRGDILPHARFMPPCSTAVPRVCPSTP